MMAAMGEESTKPASVEGADRSEADRPKALKRLPIASEPPELVPARMINEVLYCERLAYLEWAQTEFADNVYTVDGRVVHRRVDSGKGKPMPDEDEEEPPPFTARSVHLSSERLGLTAKIDVVEGEDGSVVPVEYKRGAVPDIPGGAYLPERAQVCVHVLLLREHGYRCERAEIWYAKDRRRVPIEITESLIERTMAAATRLRELASRGELPEPLIDSPKCKGCSLVGICLPDEVHLLRGLRGEPMDKEVEEPAQLTLFGDAFGPLERDAWGLAGDDPEPEPPRQVRHLTPGRDERVPLYVQAQGARLALDGDLLRVMAGGANAVDARLPQTSHIALFGSPQMSTQALAACMERDITVVFFSTGGWFRGRTVGHGSKNIELRIHQHRAADDPARALAIARVIVAAKIRNSRTLLRRNHEVPDPVLLNELESLAKKSEVAPSIASLLGLEGTAAREYFGAFGGMLKGEAAASFDLLGRNRRPPRDPVNALLSLAYALLVKDCVLAASVAGLDPLLGFLHQPRYGRPALALDLMEEMRPLIADSVVLTALNTAVVNPADFVITPLGCALSAPGRKRFIGAYERRMDQLVTHPLFGYRLSYRRLLELQARLLSRVLLGELDEYPAFRTR